MSKFKKAICYVFAVFLAFQGLLLLPATSYATEPVPPAPSSICIRINHDSGGGSGVMYRIKCTLNGVTSEFSELVSQATGAQSGHSYWQHDDSITGAGGLPEFYLDVINSDYENMRISNIVTYTGSRYVNGVFPGDNGLNEAQKRIRNFLRDLDGRLPINVHVTARTAPNSATMDVSTGCLSHFQPRITASGGAQAMVNSLKEQFVEVINESDQTASEKQDAINGLNQIFDNADDFITEADDKDLYRQFYSTNDPAAYPNVEITANVVNRLGDLVTDLATLEGSIGFNPKDHWNQVRSFFSPSFWGSGAVAIPAVAVGLAPAFLTITAASAGTLVGTRIGMAITQWQNKREYSTLLKKELKIILAYTYLKKNMSFNKCALEKGDTAYARYNEALEQRIESLFASTTTIGGSLNTSTGETACDGLKGNFILVMLKQAFCGLMIITKEWADYAYNFAMDLLASSIGVATDDQYQPTPDKITDPIKVGPTTTGEDPSSPGSGSGGTGGTSTGGTGGTGNPAGSNFSITSGSFSNGANIPVANTFLGSNKNPSVNFSNKPSGTKSFALKFVDETNSNEVRWNVFNIPASVNRIESTVGGPTAYDGIMYSGPNPSDSQRHKYVLTVYALNQETLSSYNSITNAMILAHASIIGYYQKPSETPLP